MAVPEFLSGFPLIEATSLLSALGIGSVVGYEYRSFRQRQQDQRDAVEAWYDECQDMVSHGIYRISRARIRSDINYESVVNDLDEISQRLLTKSRKDLEGVPNESKETVGQLATIYAKATSVSEVNSQKEGQDVLSEMFEMGKREYSSDVDFAETMQEASAVSDGFNLLVEATNKHGISEDEFAEALEYMFAELDGDEFAYMMSLFSEHNEEMDAVVQQSMRLFFDLAENLSEQIYEELESQKEQIV